MVGMRTGRSVCGSSCYGNKIDNELVSRKYFTTEQINYFIYLVIRAFVHCAVIFLHQNCLYISRFQYFCQFVVSQTSSYSIHPSLFVRVFPSFAFPLVPHSMIPHGNLFSCILITCSIIIAFLYLLVIYLFLHPQLP